jgi:hypothetical protein
MKKLLFISSLLIASLTLQQCDRKSHGDENKDLRGKDTEKPKTAVKMIDNLVGEWKIDSVSSRSASGDTSSNADQTLTFTEEARYILRSGKKKVDSGAFRMNEQLKNLYLESEADSKPREYEVQVSQDTLILSSKEDKGETVYIYSRN